MIQLDFFDESIVKNLVPVRTMKPDQIIFFIDERYVNSKIAINTQIAVEKMVPGILFRYVVVDENNVVDIYHKILEVVSKVDVDETIYTDLTGGNALMALTAQRIKFEYGKMNLMYADLNRGMVYDIHSRKSYAKIENITLDDYLNARGARNIRDSHHVPNDEESENILKMAEFLFDHLEDWKYLQQQFQKKTMYELLLVNHHQIENDQGADVMAIMDKFVEYGFLIDRGNGYYGYPNSKYREYVITYGIWLELYIYIKAKQYFHEEKVGFRIDWNASEQGIDPTNEIDVVVMKDSIPYFISCKMKKPAITDAYEVGYLSKNFGGDIGKGILATTYCASETDHNYSLERRCKEMGIGMIKTCQFKDESIEAIFEQAIAR